MALRYVDNFDGYVTADFTDRSWAVTGSVAISAGTGRNGTASFRSPSSSNHLTRTLDGQATWIVGFAFRFTLMPPSANNTIVQLLDAGTAQCALVINQDGTLAVVRSISTAVTGGASVLALTNNTYYYIEWKCTIADSIGANTCKVRVNGVDWITVAAGQDLKQTANATANQVRIGPNGTMGNADHDDFYVCDGTGTRNNDFLGDVKSLNSLPTGVGSLNQFTPSAGANWQNVDDTAPDDDVTYNESTTVGQADSFAMAPLAATPVAIHGVQVSVNCKKSDAGSANIACSLRSGGTTYFGPTVALGTTYSTVSNVWELDPATGSAWTRAGVDASEAGYKYIS